MNCREMLTQKFRSFSKPSYHHLGNQSVHRGSNYKREKVSFLWLLSRSSKWQLLFPKDATDYIKTICSWHGPPERVVIKRRCKTQLGQLSKPKTTNITLIYLIPLNKAPKERPVRPLNLFCSDACICTVKYKQEETETFLKFQASQVDKLSIFNWISVSNVNWSS